MATPHSPSPKSSMQPITTKLTKVLSASFKAASSVILADHCPVLLDVKSPVMLAPMAFGSTAELTAAVSVAGGYGFLPAGSSFLEPTKSPKLTLCARL